MTTLEILAVPVVEVAKCISVPLKRQICYIINYHSYANDLKNHISVLRKLQDSLKQTTEEARRRGDIVDDKGMQQWLTALEGIEVQLQTLDDDLGKAEIPCVQICGLNLSSRYKVGKRTAKMIKKVHKLQQELECISITRPAPHPGIEMMLTGHFKMFESTKLAMMNIMAALNQNHTRIIGAYGMAGVGKTSLMKVVAKQAKVSNMFGEVLIATVSQNPDLKKIQCEIAEGLGLRLQEESGLIRALRLAARVKQERSILIILDDVWKRLELADVGIPSGEDYSGCKVVVTTRSLDVCREMDSDESVMLEVLSDEDSWDLFRRVAGSSVESPELCDVATEITKECRGLPLALVTLGRLLRNKELSVWLDAAIELRASRPVNIKGMHENVFSCLKLSFDQAQTEEAKLCYLYCSLFPEDYDVKVEDLVRYATGEGLFPETETVDEARNKVLSIISHLKSSSLLLNSEREGCVKMHDVFRDLAISIASSNDFGFMVKASTGLKEWPTRPNLENVMRLSLMDNEFSEFPGQRVYPELLLLLLQNNRKLRSIPDDFFPGMTALQVLDLSHIPNIMTLPRSLSCLTNLKTLCIENNHLEDLSALKELHSLEILSLRKCFLTVLPEQIRGLKSLRLLDLTESHVEAIPSKVISSLSKIEELYMGHSYSSWEIAEPHGEGTATLEEVTSLTHLSILSIDINNLSCLIKDVATNWQNLKKFHIQIGEKCHMQPTRRASLCFNMSDEANVPSPFINWIHKLMERTEELCLSQWRNLCSLEELQIENFASMKSLHVQRCGLQNCLSSALIERLGHLMDIEVSSCNDLEVIFLASHTNPSISVLPALTRLHLEDLPGLETIWKGAVPSVCFENLTCVKADYCMHLRDLFSSELAMTLKQLKRLEVSNCDRLETIISNDIDEVRGGSTLEKTNSNNTVAQFPRSEDTKIFFPQLRNLNLICLHSMTTLARPWREVDFPSLEKLTLLSCPGLKRLPFPATCLLRLRGIKARRQWLEKLEFDDERIKPHLLNCSIGISTSLCFMSLFFLNFSEVVVSRQWHSKGGRGEV